MEGEPHILSSDEADDQDDRLDDARRDREQRIMAAIARAFKRLRIALAHDDDPAIYYSEDDREATVRLADSSIDLDVLLGLRQSGLADRYQVKNGLEHGLDIVFIVSPALDNII